MSAVLGLGSPLGWGLLRLLGHYQPPFGAWFLEELRTYGLIYLYTGVGTVCAFSLLGYSLGKKYQRLGRNLDQAAKATDDAVQLSRIDQLTGIASRGYLMQRLEEEVKRAERHNAPLACLFIDLDGLKALNEKFGHLAGDAALKAVGQVLRQVARGSDIVGRFGGDEFVAVLPETTSDGARGIAERIRTEVQTTAFRTEGERHALTVSIGVHVAVPQAVDPAELLRAADKALRQSKIEGKNRTVVAG